MSDEEVHITIEWLNDFIPDLKKLSLISSVTDDWVLRDDTWDHMQHAARPSGLDIEWDLEETNWMLC